MSRSNPHVNAPSPVVRWFEWNGEHGTVRYYDKDDKKNVAVPCPFSFILLDQVGSVRGWHDASESGIYSNEVRDTRKDLILVKAFKGGTLAEGLYKDIKDRVNTLGGQFVANLYIAVQDDSEPNDPQWGIASLRLKGAALGAWMDFSKAHRRDLYANGVAITGYTEGKKGRIVFRVPTFAVQELSTAANAIAVDLDKELQAWLSAYFARTTQAQVPAQDEPRDDDTLDDQVHNEPLTDDDIPF